MRYSSPINNIDGVDLCVAGIEVHFYPSLVSHHEIQYIKKCVLCRKVSYWSTNHTQKEHDKSKKKFGDCYSKYKAWPSNEQDLQHQITEYEAIEDDERVVQYFEDLSINTQNDNTSKLEFFSIESE